MRFRTALSLATLWLTRFTVAACSTPAPGEYIDSDSPPVPDHQSLCGKIASIGDAALALAVAKGQEVSTVPFLVEDQTKVAGQPKVGAPATVEYRSNAGNNIAVQVPVTPSSETSWY